MISPYPFPGRMLGILAATALGLCACRSAEPQHHRFPGAMASQSRPPQPSAKDQFRLSALADNARQALALGDDVAPLEDVERAMGQGGAPGQTAILSPPPAPADSAGADVQTHLLSADVSLLQGKSGPAQRELTFVARRTAPALSDSERLLLRASTALDLAGAAAAAAQTSHSSLQLHIAEQALDAYADSGDQHAGDALALASALRTNLSSPARLEANAALQMAQAGSQASQWLDEMVRSSSPHPGASTAGRGLSTTAALASASG